MLKEIPELTTSHGDENHDIQKNSDEIGDANVELDSNKAQKPYLLRREKFQNLN